MTTEELAAGLSEAQLEDLASIIARSMGDNFTDAFKDKSQLISRRGVSGGRFRDVHEPFQSNYLDAARAAAAYLRDRVTDALNMQQEARVKELETALKRVTTLFQESWEHSYD